MASTGGSTPVHNTSCAAAWCTSIPRPSSTVAPRASITADVMGKMLAADNGISTSHFQLHDAAGGRIAVTLNNFVKLQDMGPGDEDDVLSAVHFLLVDVMSARRLLSGLAA